MPKTLKEINEVFDNISELPALPHIAVQLLDLIEQENVPLRKIVNLISVDPALATAVLKVANSVLYAMPQRISSLRRAFVILGTNEISNIILSVSFSKVFPIVKNSQFNMKKFWQHSVLTGYIAQLIAKQMNLSIQGEVYTAGLIHDIGKLILFKYFTNEFNQILEIIRKKNMPNYIAEKMVLGATHMHLGALLARKWNLPDSLVQGIMYHHKPQFADSNEVVVALVNLGDYYANMLRIYPIPTGRKISQTSQSLRILRQKSRGFDLYKFQKKLKDEIPKAKKFLSMFIRNMMLK